MTPTDPPTEPTRYVWATRRKAGAAPYLGLAVHFVGFGVGAYLLYAFFQFLADVNSVGWAVTFAVVGLVLVLTGIVLLLAGVAFTPRDRAADAPPYRTILRLNFLALLGLLAFLFGTAEVRAGFTGPVESGGNWLLFFLDHAVRVVTLDVSELLGFSWSGIEPAAWWARALTLLLKLTLCFGLVDLLLESYAAWRGEQQFVGTEAECWAWWDERENGGLNAAVELFRVGRVEPLPPSPPVRAEDLG